jgi:hypothetical protein
MAQLFTVFFQVLVSIVSGIISLASKLVSAIFSLVATGTKKYGEKRNIKTLQDIISKIEAAKSTNNHMKSLAEQVKHSMPKEAKEFATIG